MKASLDVVCVGAGYFSHFHLKAWQRIPETRLCGVCDANLERAQATGLAAFADLKSMLKALTPDILDVITPPVTHVSVIGQAISAGVRVIICQKPFCENVNQAEAVTRQAVDAGVRLIVHENFRFQPWFRVVKEQLDLGALGAVQQAQFRLRTGDGQGPAAYLDRQPYFQRMERLLVHETAVHYIDVFRYLFGEAESVYADLRRLNPAIVGEDAGIIILDYPNQIKAVIDGNRHLDFATSNTRLTFGELIVEGCEATLQLHGDGRLTRRAFGEVQAHCLLEPQDWPGFAGDSVHAFQSHVVDHLIAGSLLENSAQDYLHVLKLEQLVYDSSERGCKLMLSHAPSYQPQ